MSIAGFGYAEIQEKLQAMLAGPDGVALYLVWATVGLATNFTCWQTAGPGAGARGFAWHCLPRGSSPRGILTHMSARADFLFWPSRRLFMPLFVAPLALSTVTAGYAAYDLLTLMFSPAKHTDAADAVTLCLATLSMVPAYDLSYYIYHYLYDRVPLLWELPKVHPSAQEGSVAGRPGTFGMASCLWQSAMKCP